MGSKLTTETTFYGSEQQQTAGSNAILDTNIADDGTALTQYITLYPHNVMHGRLMYVQIYIDSANNRSFDLVLAKGTSGTSQAQMSKYFFQSDEYSDVGDQGIADATLETFECDRPFTLDAAGRMYLTLYSSAGAFGNVTGRLKVAGVAYI